MVKEYRLTLCCVIIALMLPSFTVAQSKVGTTAANFLQIGVGGRGVATGEFWHQKVRTCRAKSSGGDSEGAQTRHGGDRIQSSPSGREEAQGRQIFGHRVSSQVR